MENIGLIIAIVGVGLSMVGVMLALFLWNRGEGDSDRRYGLDSMDSIRNELNRIRERVNQMQKRGK